MLAVAQLFESKSGVKLPSIEQKIVNLGRAFLPMDGDAKEGAVETLLMEGIKERTTQARISAGNAVGSGGVRMIPATPYVSPVPRKHISSALQRLTKPTPETIRKTTSVKSKCEKFEAFSALDAAMNRDVDAPRSQEERERILEKIRLRKAKLLENLSSNDNYDDGNNNISSVNNDSSSEKVDNSDTVQDESDQKS